MADKTNVIDPVAESGKTQVNPQSDEGKSPSEKELENKIRENLKAEYSRKETVLSEKLSATEERLAELEEQVRLTAAEKAERAKLESKRDTLEDQIEELRANPAAKPWFRHLEREVERATLAGEARGSMRALTELAADFVEDMAEKDEMKDTELLGELEPYFGKFAKKNPLRKTQLAYKAWQEHQTFKKEKDEVAKEKAKLESSRENGTRTSRATTLADAEKANDRTAMRELLGINHKAK